MTEYFYKIRSLKNFKGKINQVSITDIHNRRGKIISVSDDKQRVLIQYNDKESPTSVWIPAVFLTNEQLKKLGLKKV